MKPLRNFIPDTISSIYPDSLSRNYNNIWGSYSDTNMRRLPDNSWEITGHAIQYTGYFVSLLTCTHIPQSQFINLKQSFNDILKSLNLYAWFDKDSAGFPIVKVNICNDLSCEPGLSIPDGISPEVCCTGTCMAPPVVPDDF